MVAVVHALIMAKSATTFLFEATSDILLLLRYLRWIFEMVCCNFSFQGKARKIFDCHIHSGTSTLTHSPLLPPILRQWIGSALVQIMACCLFHAKPLSKPMLGHYQLDPKEQISVIFLIKTLNLSLKKTHLKVSSAKGGHFASASMC